MRGNTSIRKSDDPRDYQDAPGIAAVMPKAFPDGFVVEEHRHTRAQLVYATTGIAEVMTPHSLWLVPPHQGLWIPPALPHALRARGALDMRTVYVRPDAYALMHSDRPALVNVSSLLRELILRISYFPLDIPPVGRDDLVVRLMLTEIERSPEEPLSLPRRGDRRLGRICKAIVANPADTKTLLEWANEVGASERTLSRLFYAEFGSSFTLWRQQARISAARPLLAAGRPVTVVASELGYQTTGAFSSMFRRLTGMTPSHYMKLSDST